MVGFDPQVPEMYWCVSTRAYESVARLNAVGLFHRGTGPSAGVKSVPSGNITLISARYLSDWPGGFVTLMGLGFQNTQTHHFTFSVCIS